MKVGTKKWVSFSNKPQRKRNLQEHPKKRNPQEIHIKKEIKNKLTTKKKKRIFLLLLKKIKMREVHSEDVGSSFVCLFVFFLFDFQFLTK